MAPKLKVVFLAATAGIAFTLYTTLKKPDVEAIKGGFERPSGITTPYSSATQVSMIDQYKAKCPSESFRTVLEVDEKTGTIFLSHYTQDADPSSKREGSFPTELANIGTFKGLIHPTEISVTGIEGRVLNISGDRRWWDEGTRPYSGHIPAQRIFGEVDKVTGALYESAPKHVQKRVSWFIQKVEEQKQKRVDGLIQGRQGYTLTQIPNLIGAKMGLGSRPVGETYRISLELPKGEGKKFELEIAETIQLGSTMSTQGTFPNRSGVIEQAIPFSIKTRGREEKKLPKRTGPEEVVTGYIACLLLDEFSENPRQRDTLICQEFLLTSEELDRIFQPANTNNGKIPHGLTLTDPRRIRRFQTEEISRARKLIGEESVSKLEELRSAPEKERRRCIEEILGDAKIKIKEKGQWDQIKSSWKYQFIPRSTGESMTILTINGQNFYLAGQGDHKIAQRWIP